MDKKLLKILPSDIISESMDKINYNFDLISSIADIADFSMASFKKRLDELIAEFKSNFDLDNNALKLRIERLEEELEDLLIRLLNGEFGGSGSGSGAGTITSFVFIVDNYGVDFRQYVPEGGSFSDPYPNPRDFTYEGHSYKWEDSPTNVGVDSVVWMSKAVFTTDSSEPIISWTLPSKMADSSSFNVEWCETKLSVSDFETVKNKVCSNTYNFGVYLSKVRTSPSKYSLSESDLDDYSKVETAAETAWRNDLKKISISEGTLSFTDNPDKAYYMATATLRNGVWKNWDFVKVAGETGEAGESVFCSYVFTKDDGGHDLSQLTLTGGDFDNPYPNKSVKKWDGDLYETEYEWEDSPTNVSGNDTIWMAKRKFKSTDEKIDDWSTPVKMMDSANINVEWCETDLDVDDFNTLKTLISGADYNFGKYLKEVYADSNFADADYNEIEEEAEKRWRAAVKNLITGKEVIFTDTPRDTYFMATTTLKNGVWTNWNLVDVKGESAESVYYSYVFTKDTMGYNLSDLEVSGGTYANPIPDPSVFTNENNEDITYTWEDSPSNVTSDSTIWMVKGKFSSENPDSPEWGKPTRMMDGAEINVEWCQNEVSSANFKSAVSTLKTNEDYNFGRFLNFVEVNAGSNVTFDGKTYDLSSVNKTIYKAKEEAAEKIWRDYVKKQLGLDFTDTPEKTYYMATTTKSNGVWSGWDLVNVKGEKGDDGTSISFQGGIKYEGYYDDIDEFPTNYTSSNSENAVKILFNENAKYKKCDFAVIYPYKSDADIPYSGDINNSIHLFIWNETEWVVANASNCSNLDIVLSLGYSLLCPHGHLLIWDGDNWVDAGRIKGADGANGLSGKSVYIKMAIYDNSEKIYEEVTESAMSSGKIPTHIGLYIASPDDEDFDTTNLDNYNWFRFKGEDSFGYEYIYKATKSDQAPDVPVVPTADKNKYELNDYCPEGWSDDPLPLSYTNKYVWMCWRKKENGAWTKGFIGQGGRDYEGATPDKAILWGNFTEETKVSYVFTHSTPDVDLSNVNVINDTDTTYANPIPKNNIFNSVTYIWKDVPTDVPSGHIIWMSYAVFTSNPSELPTWSKPVRMSDSTEFNVEWCITDLTNTQFNNLKTAIESNTYNFGTYIQKAKEKLSEESEDLSDYNSIETKAEELWRADVALIDDSGDPDFTDEPGNKAYFMATCSCNNGVWTNWTLVDVAGEDGQPGIPGASIFCSYAYTKDTHGYDLTGLSVSGGTYTTPIPEPSEYTNAKGEKITFVWEDSPSNISADATIWMTKRDFSSNNSISSGWSEPVKMMDNSILNVEWCTTNITNESYIGGIRQALRQEQYNFGKFLNIVEDEVTKFIEDETPLESRNYNGVYLGNVNLSDYKSKEEAAEELWRKEVKKLTGQPDFTDTPNNAYFMATTTKSDGKWSHWDFVKVAGEKGDDGISYKRLYYLWKRPSTMVGTSVEFVSASLPATVDGKNNNQKDKPAIKINYNIHNEQSGLNTMGVKYIIDSRDKDYISSENQSIYDTESTISADMSEVSDINPILIVIERSGSEGNWGSWSNPIVVNRFYDPAGLDPAELEGIIGGYVDGYMADVENAFEQLGVTDLGDDNILDTISGKIFTSSEAAGKFTSDLESFKTDVKTNYAQKNMIVANSYFAKDKDGNFLTKEGTNVMKDSLVYKSDKKTPFNNLDTYLEYTEETYCYKRITSLALLSKDDYYKIEGLNIIGISPRDDYAMISNGNNYIKTFNSANEYVAEIYVPDYTGDIYIDNKKVTTSSLIKIKKYQTIRITKDLSLVGWTITSNIKKDASYTTNTYEPSTPSTPGTSVVETPSGRSAAPAVSGENLSGNEISKGEIDNVTTETNESASEQASGSTGENVIGSPTINESGSLNNNYVNGNTVSVQTNYSYFSVTFKDFNIFKTSETSRPTGSKITVEEAVNYLMLVTDHLSGITQEVTSNSATTALIASKGGGDIVAGIFAMANESGSNISLNADKINLNGDVIANKLSAESATLRNIYIDESCKIGGNLSVNKIEAIENDSKLNIDAEHFEITRNGSELFLEMMSGKRLSDEFGVSTIANETLNTDDLVPVLKFKWKDKYYIISPDILKTVKPQPTVHNGSYSNFYTDVFKFVKNNTTGAYDFNLSCSKVFYPKIKDDTTYNVTISCYDGRYTIDGNNNIGSLEGLSNDIISHFTSDAECAHYTFEDASSLPGYNVYAQLQGYMYGGWVQNFNTEWRLIVSRGGWEKDEVTGEYYYTGGTYRLFDFSNGNFKNYLNDIAGNSLTDGKYIPFGTSGKWFRLKQKGQDENATSCFSGLVKVNFKRYFNVNNAQIGTKQGTEYVFVPVLQIFGEIYHTEPGCTGQSYKLYDEGHLINNMNDLENVWKFYNNDRRLITYEVTDFGAMGYKLNRFGDIFKPITIDDDDLGKISTDEPIYKFIKTFIEQTERIS